MGYSYTDYRLALNKSREAGLPEENFYMYIETKGGAVEFSAEETKRPGYIGYFVEDDERIPGIINVASRKIKTK